MFNHPSSTPVTVMSQLEDQQAALGLSDEELSTAVGFDRQIALTLIKQGVMKLPLNKVPAFAAALALDPADLLRAAIRESDPALGQLIEEVFNPMRLIATEVTLIKHLRELSGDAAVAPIVFNKGVIALVATGNDAHIN